MDSGVGVICLSASYGIPIAVSFFRGRKHVVRGKFNCGVLGYIANVVAIGWTALSVPLFCFPSEYLRSALADMTDNVAATIPVTAEGMNYASVVFAFSVAASAAWYFVWGRKHYHGPPVDTDPALAAAGLVDPSGQKITTEPGAASDKKH